MALEEFYSHIRIKMVNKRINVWTNIIFFEKNREKFYRNFRFFLYNLKNNTRREHFDSRFVISRSKYID